MEKNKQFIVSRSWRRFGKQQAVGLLSLYKKIHKLHPEFHFNINEKVEQEWVDFVHNFIPKEKLILYNDDFFKNYAKSKNINQDTINKFKEWKWIYHILIYYYLYEQNVDYILTYDDDILFNEKDIDEVIDCIQNKIPFGIGEYNGYSDKTLLGKLIIYFDKKGIDINQKYWLCEPQNLSINSGFLGMKVEFFDKYDSLNDILNFFPMKKYGYLNGPKESWSKEKSFFNLFNYLLGEQSFLAINSKSFYNDIFRTLWVADGYNIEYKDIVEHNYPERTKVEHYLGYNKYQQTYKSRLDKEYWTFKWLISEKKDLDKFYELGIDEFR